MGKLPSAAARTSRRTSVLILVGRMLLLVPEAVLLVVQLCAYTIWPDSLIALLVVLEVGRPVEAAQAAQVALALDVRCAVAHLHLAQAERARGAAAQVVEDRLRAGLATEPSPAAEAVIRCVLAAHLLAEQRIAEATLTLHGAEALLPRCPAPSQAILRIHLGEILIAQGQIERAQEYIQSPAPLHPHGRYATVAWRVAQL